VNEQALLKQYAKAIFHELFRSKNGYNLLASLILLSTVVVGYFWDERYRSSATLEVRENIYIDAGQRASQQRVDTQRLLSLFESRAIVKGVAEKIIQRDASAASNSHSILEDFQLRSSAVRKDNRVVFSYDAASPEKAKLGMEILLRTLLENVHAKIKIQALSQQYNDALVEESRLRALIEDKESVLESLRKNSFSLAPLSSRERLSNIMQQRQDVTINIREIEAKIAVIKERIPTEQANLLDRQKMQALLAAKTKAETAIEKSRSLYSANDAEVVSLQNELDNITSKIAKMKSSRSIELDGEQNRESLYEQLRRQLTLSEVELEALKARRNSLSNILEQESQLLQTEAADAEEIERAEKTLLAFNRDFDVAVQQRMSIFEAKTKLEKNTSEFYVQDAPSYPSSYHGLGFVEFLILGPILAFGLPFLIAFVIVFSDSRIRTSNQLNRCLPSRVAILGAVPHSESPKTARVFRHAIFGLAIWGAFVVCVYITVVIVGLRN